MFLFRAAGNSRKKAAMRTTCDRSLAESTWRGDSAHRDFFAYELPVRSAPRSGPCVNTIETRRESDDDEDGAKS
jgi:hypothetical protein